jgi:hypothetical protein
MLKRELNQSVTSGNSLSLEDIKGEFRQIFSSSKSKDYNHRERNKEAALNARQGNNNRFKKQFKGDCRHCGMKGHKSQDCWERPENKEKRPENWKTKKGREAAHATTHSTLKCDYCHKDGHTEDRCFKKKREQEQRSTASAHPTREVALCIYEAALISRAK